jgi:hypothetical protein
VELFIAGFYFCWPAAGAKFSIIKRAVFTF